MEHRDIVVIGASAGGLEALREILSGLPPDLEAAVMIVLHTASHEKSLLPQILERAGKLPVSHPSDGEAIERGRVYIAPPSFHMIVEDGVLRVLQGPRENLHRPAIDPLFRSAAAAYGERVIGVILTGMLDDGTAGLMVVSARGGKAIVQDPDTALYPGMPRSALDNVPAARVATLQDIPALLVQLIGSPVPAGTSRLRNVPFGAAKETRIAELDMNEITSEERASNTEANSRILRDFLLRVNTAETIDSDDAPHSLDESPESSSA